MLKKVIGSRSFKERCLEEPRDQATDGRLSNKSRKPIRNRQTRSKTKQTRSCICLKHTTGSTCKTRTYLDGIKACLESRFSIAASGQSSLS